MKFIKGDAIAGIIIIFVNFVGGIVVANVRSNMSMSEAIGTYSMLTIGDGLVAQIPALLISVGAGFVVTRVRSEESNLGRNILSQVGGRAQVLVVVGVLCLLLAALPGFPVIIFVLMACGLFAIAVQRSGGMPAVRGFFGKRLPATAQDAESAHIGGKGAGSAMPHDSDDITQVIPETVPLALIVPPGDRALMTQGKFAEALRNEVYFRLGIKIPMPLLAERQDVPARQVWLLVNEVVAEKVGLIPGHALVLAQAAQVQGLGVPHEVLHSDTGDVSVWVSDQHLQALKQIDIPLRDWRDELQRRFVSLAARSSHEYFGIQETKNLMDAMERKFPELLKETYRNAPVQRIAQILQRLLAENVSVRNLKVVLEAIAQWAPKERDNILLAEHVRTALSRYISDRVTIDGRINALLIAPETEELIRQNIKQTANGAYLQMPDEDNSVFIADLAGKLAALYQPTDQVVLLTTLDVRRFVKRLIEPHFPDVSVISFGEIADQGKLNIVNTI
jgi:type III secretion protein V